MSSNKEHSSSTQTSITLAQLMNTEGNNICADCRVQHPKWTSWSLGIFICMQCAGLHRDLGVHISKVKSVTLDIWKNEYIEILSCVGNKKSNEYFEAKLPANFIIPSNKMEMKLHLNNKYVRKLYADSNKKPPSTLTDLNNKTEKSIISSKDKQMININSEKKDQYPDLIDLFEINVQSNTLEPHLQTNHNDLFGQVNSYNNNFMSTQYHQNNSFPGNFNHSSPNISSQSPGNYHNCFYDDTFRSPMNVSNMHQANAMNFHSNNYTNNNSYKTQFNQSNKNNSNISDPFDEIFK